MSKKANATTIGIFIVTGVALAVIAVLVLATGRLFARHEKFILYFDSSLKGLNLGAPVKARGVTIGSVAEIYIHHNQAENDYTKPVVIAIDDRLLQAKIDRPHSAGDKDWVREQVKAGMRGKLDAESLLTGMLYVELETITNAPPSRPHQLKPEYIEIPTVPTEIQELLSNLARVDVHGISQKLSALLSRLDTTIVDLNLQKIGASVTNLLASTAQVIRSPDVTNSLNELKQTLGETRALLRRLDARVDPIADGLTNTLAQAEKTLVELRQGIETFNGMIEPDAGLRTDVARALDNLSQAANAITDLANFLQRNPNALLTGRKPPVSKP
jgi:paraquat-inducible protein B